MAGDVTLDDVYLTYKGFCCNNLNLEINVGQLYSPSCLENFISSKYTPFLERSLPATTFLPCLGIGASVVTWDKCYSFIAAITAPAHTDHQDDTANNRQYRSTLVWK